MAEVIRYVDPDASGSANGTSWVDAYTSLNGCLESEAVDLVTATDWLHIYCRSSSGTVDTTAVVQYDSWWVTSPTYKVVIEAASGHEAVKSGIDSSRYLLSVTDSDAFYIDDGEYFDIIGLQIEVTDTTGGVSGVHFRNTTSGLIKNCYIDVSTTNDGCKGIELDDGDYEIENTIVVVSSNATDDYLYSGIYLTGCNSITVYNSNVYGDGNGRGFRIQDTSVTITNCAVSNFGDSVFHGGTGTDTIDSCASDDGDGTNSVSPSGSDWTNEFSDPANGDFTLLNTGNLYQGGTTIVGGPSTDIDGDSWGSPPSIGADEYSAGATQSTVPHIMLAHNQFTGGL